MKPQLRGPIHGSDIGYAAGVGAPTPNNGPIMKVMATFERTRVLANRVQNLAERLAGTAPDFDGHAQEVLPGIFGEIATTAESTDEYIRRAIAEIDRIESHLQ